MIGKTNIYIDGGNPEETRSANERLQAAGKSGLDGQTTNPTLIAKQLAEQVKRKVTMDEAVSEYKRIVTEMRKSIDGPISIQVLGNPEELTAKDMLSQARERNGWIPNAVIKFPCTTEGLEAAGEFCQEGAVNITLVFSQEQAGAVYSATKYHNYPVYVSPFVGRIDDTGENGMDVVANILEMYRRFGDTHVNVLTASVRSIKHIQYALWLRSQIITLPYKTFLEWGEGGFPLPDENFLYSASGLIDIPYRELSLDKEWDEYDIHHELTDTGVYKFWEDFSKILK